MEKLSTKILHNVLQEYFPDEIKYKKLSKKDLILFIKQLEGFDESTMLPVAYVPTFTIKYGSFHPFKTT